MLFRSTKSTLVNDFIKMIRKLEVRRLGKPPQARRPMTDNEFRQIKTLCITKSEKKCTISKFGVPAEMNFQFHMLSRVDDTCNVPRENLEVHPTFPFLLMTKLN